MAAALLAGAAAVSAQIHVQGPGDDFLRFEAEAGAITPGAGNQVWTIVPDPLAIGGATSLVSLGAGFDGSPASTSFVDYSLQFATPGDYTIYYTFRPDIQKIIDSGNDLYRGNSFRLPTVLGGAPSVTSDGANGNAGPNPDLGQVSVYESAKELARKYTVTQAMIDAGPVNFRIGDREPGTFIDRFYFSLNDAFTVSNGIPLDPSWFLDGVGDWSVDSHWFLGVPNSPGAVANFADVIFGAATVNVDIPVAVEQINFNTPSGASITISGPQTITLSHVPVSPRAGNEINVLAGNHAILAPLAGTLESLNIAGSSRLDIGGNSLAIVTEDAGTLAQITGYLTSGYAGGAWNGSGLVSSLAGGSLSLGIVGSTAEAVSTVAVRLTFVGDTNLDGQVDVSDLGNLASGWQQPGGWGSGDFNYDGVVDVSDLGALASTWQAGVTGPAAPGASFEALLASFGLSGIVPEPGLLSLVGLAGLALRRR